MNYAIDLNKLRAEAFTPEATVRGLRSAVRGVYREQLNGIDEATVDGISMLAIRDVESVVQQMIETVYPPLKADMLVPMGSEGVAPYSNELVYQRVTRHGLADYIVNGQMPRSDVTMQEERIKIRNIGGEIGWDFFEIQAAAQGGVSLDTAKYGAIEQSVRTSRNMIMLVGDAGLPSGGGLISTGFANDANVPSMSATGGAWSGLTATQIIASFTGYWNTYNAQVKQAMQPDTIAVPSNRYYTLLNPISAGSEMTILAYLLKNLPGLQSIEQLDELNTAGAGAGTRMVIYRKAPDVLVGVIPMSYRLFAPQQQGLRVAVQAAERLAGCIWKFPAGGLYVDGL